MKINIVGKDGVGKSCFKRSMLKQKFQHQPSTDGIVESAAIAAEVTVSDARDWREISPEVEKMADRVITLSAAQIAEDDDDWTMINLSEVEDESADVACNENCTSLSDYIYVGDLSYTALPEEESPPCESPSLSEYQEVKDVDVPLEPLFDITALTSSKNLSSKNSEPVRVPERKSLRKCQ